ncbi:helix-turn-helix domain-containing protein [Emticicia sp. CRIBPO]|uniref:AraC family transcriptional regulator n=1 Tax=Emticicia sp. CRIBPO TaxID=2683258 RepID=UPI001413290E|nr:AraC family transcriptional regulator [Emticicia sp. CRIBPO]NBA85944.1 helix-turn-helix domain-containing protein [Emticicia sp. CRIBPO]
MKASLEYLADHDYDTVLVRKFELTTFQHAYHFHPEFELTLVLKGHGKRYVGNHVDDFEAGDLVLLGPDLPHCWLSGPDFEGEAEAVVIQFRENFAGEGFLGLKALEQIRNLLELSGAGLCVEKAAVPVISRDIEDLVNRPFFDQLHGLLGVLQKIAIQNQFHLLDDQFLHFNKTFSETLRFQRVYGHLIENYTSDISLDEIASVASLSQTAFCRYFKKTTGKTFVEVLNEFRIKHAVNLLQQSEKSVSEIGLESGFDDLSYFTKTFKKYKKISPLAFRRLTVNA